MKAAEQRQRQHLTTLFLGVFFCQIKLSLANGACLTDLFFLRKIVKNHSPGSNVIFDPKTGTFLFQNQTLWGLTFRISCTAELHFLNITPYVSVNFKILALYFETFL